MEAVSERVRETWGTWDFWRKVASLQLKLPVPRTGILSGTGAASPSSFQHTSAAGLNAGAFSPGK